MRNSREKLKRGGGKKETTATQKALKKSGTVETYSVEQLSVLHKVEMWEEEARTPAVKQSFVLWPSRGGRRCEATFSLRWNMAAVCQLFCRRRSASTVVSFSLFLQSSIRLCVQENAHFACPLPDSLAGFCSSLHVCSSRQGNDRLNWPLMQCKAIWSPSDMFFFFYLFQKTPKVLQLQVLCLT